MGCRCSRLYAPTHTLPDSHASSLPPSLLWFWEERSEKHRPEHTRLHQPSYHSYLRPPYKRSGRLRKRDAPTSNPLSPGPGGLMNWGFEDSNIIAENVIPVKAGFQNGISSSSPGSREREVGLRSSSYRPAALSRTGRSSLAFD